MATNRQVTEAVASLYSWFGERRFRIEDLHGMRLETMVNTWQIDNPTDIGNRSEVGKELHGLDGQTFNLPRGERVQFQVVLPSNTREEGQVGVYKIRQIR